MDRLCSGTTGTKTIDNIYTNRIFAVDPSWKSLPNVPPQYLSNSPRIFLEGEGTQTTYVRNLRDDQEMIMKQGKKVCKTTAVQCYQSLS